jgi:hypothetical protein
LDYLVINFNRFLGDLVEVLISGGIFKCFRLSQSWRSPENSGTIFGLIKIVLLMGFFHIYNLMISMDL